MKLVFQMYDACLLCYQWCSASVEKRAQTSAHTHAHTHTHTHTYTLYQKSGKEVKLRNMAKM